MVIFFLVLFFSLIIGGATAAHSNRYISKLFSFSFVPASLFMMARRLDIDADCIKILWRFCVVLGLYLGFTGLCEHYGVDSLVFPKYILDNSVGIHFGRVRGPFVQAVVMGGALVMVGLFIVWYHYNFSKSFVTWIVLFPVLASTYFTETRAVWLQLGVSIGILGLFRNRLRKPVIAMVLLIVLIFFSGMASNFSAYRVSLFKKRDAQIDDRINIYYASWRMFVARPIAGFGYGSYESKSDDYFVQLDGVELRGQGEGQHHTILGLMCETGLLGTVPYVMILLLFLRKSYFRYLETKRLASYHASLALITLSMVAGCIVSMQFSDFGFYNFLNNVMFWFCGISYNPGIQRVAVPLEQSISPRAAS